MHESGDGSPTGLVNALGWETILAKTSQEALLFALDAFAKKIGLVANAAAAASSGDDDDNIAVPDIPTDLQPPSLADDTGASPWVDVSSRNAPPMSDPPASFGIIDEDTTAEKPKIQPPPVPPARKRL